MWTIPLVRCRSWSLEDPRRWDEWSVFGVRRAFVLQSKDTEVDNISEFVNSYPKSGPEELVDIVGIHPESILRPEEVWICSGRRGCVGPV